MSPDIIIGAVSTAVIMLLGQITKSLIDSRKQKSESTLSANDQAFLVYKSLVETLQKNVSQINTDMNKLEQEFLLCRENNVELRMLNKALTEKNTELTHKIATLEQELVKLRSPK